MVHARRVRKNEAELFKRWRRVRKRPTQGRCREGARRSKKILRVRLPMQEWCRELAARERRVVAVQLRGRRRALMELHRRQHLQVSSEHYGSCSRRAMFTTKNLLWWRLQLRQLQSFNVVLVKCLVMMWRLSRVVLLNVWFVGYVDK